MRIGVVIATKGRPQAATRVLRSLERQTLKPVVVVVSATSRDDVESDLSTPLNMKLVFGSAGTCAQRNRGLICMRASCGIVATPRS